MIKIKKFFGDKNFYKTVLKVALPIMIQNGITNFVSLLDNVMVGQIGTEQMSGVAIVNQLIFVFNLCIFGSVSGAGIFTAQFHGKKDEEGVRQTLRFKILTCFLLTVLAVGIFLLWDEELISLYLNEGSAEGDLTATLGYGKDYLFIMLIGLLPYALSQVYGSTLRETESTFLPMVAGFVAVCCNCLGNYLLIFGIGACPALGVVGAGISTVVSRFVEAGILVVAVRVKSKKYTFIRSAFKRLFAIDKSLVKVIMKKGMPLLINEGLWSLGMSILAQSYSLRGLSAVAAYNITSTVWNVFNIAYIALGNAVGIIIGKYLGAEQFEEAVDIDRKLITFCVLVGAFFGTAMCLSAPYIPNLYNTTDEVKDIACSLLRVQGILMPIGSFLHSCYFTLRSGGKTIITFCFDSGYICLIAVPVAMILANFTALPIVPLFAVCNGLDILKCVIGAVFLKKKNWVNQIV